ncbi:gamma-glutamylcyclotransferase [Roseivivax sediminis]|uniref:Putative gamma-glutamylcyclotransferase n=1 Tax=Roseivivax sediminis TaxID=936889 RepID=A0A1I1S9U8_9RHOB|nr:gamma-glutamylcyclotransferase [Roseivivax sediminis]SFD43265.1 nudix-type nucleoside diphosphatase, YffH/AdpP family [Roseivivax sediminis]
MTDLFVFGTLRHVPLLTCVLGRAPGAAEPAVLPGHRALAVKGEDFPVLAPDPEAEAPGLLLRGLSAAELERMDHYEGSYGYALAPVRVEAVEGLVPAQVYVPQADLPEATGPWDFEAWRARWGEIAILAAEEAMDNLAAGQPGAPRFARMSRAWARLNGREGAPQTLRSALTRADVGPINWKPGFDGFFRLRRFTLSHKTFAGGRSPEVSREGFAAFDAALVLPYDPATDRVLLIEQLRYGPLLRDDPTPWMLEPVAGLVDAGEDPADTARREAAEEARLTLKGLEPMLRFYASPGYTSEYFHCFLGLADLSAHDGTLAGLDAENEDIRSHVIPFDRAMALIESGEINVGPLITMLLWLAGNRDRLRAAA